MTQDEFINYIENQKKRKLAVIFAHRGVSSMANDNSIQAIKLGLEMEHLDGIEIDVQATKDNILIVKHDFTLNEIEGNPYVKDLTLNEIRQHKSPEDCPLFTDVLEIFRDTKKIIDIEIKSPNIAEKIVKLCKTYKIYDRVVFTVVYESINDEIRKIDPNVARIYGYPRDRGKNLALQWWTQPFVKMIVYYIKKSAPFKIRKIMTEVNTPFISLYEKIITQDLVNRIHKEGYYCIGATINIQNDQSTKYAQAAIDRMVKMGVDVIKTDHPQLGTSL